MGTVLKLTFWLLAVLGVILGVLYAFFLDVWVLPTDDPMLSASVEPNVSAGDVLVLGREGTVGYGNLLRCADPQAPGRFVVARAIAHAGEKIVIENEIVLVDGKRTPSPRACDAIQHTLRDPTTGEDVDLTCSVEDYGIEFDALHLSAHPLPATSATVEPGRWFLVSDDRHIHVDSRDYGAVDAQTCEHILFRVVGAGGLRDAKSRFTIIW
jgi:signal peptidase I